MEAYIQTVLCLLLEQLERQGVLDPALGSRARELARKRRELPPLWQGGGEEEEA